jgi:DNA-directed RNA polymerase subunit M/transcription elongation factor TFIIS
MWIIMSEIALHTSERIGMDVLQSEGAAAPSCRCAERMQLALVIRHADGTQVRKYTCIDCEHELRVTHWAH